MKNAGHAGIGWHKLPHLEHVEKFTACTKFPACAGRVAGALGVS